MKYCWILFLLGAFILFTQTCNKVSEGFISYKDCILNGYTKAFCVQTPTSLFGPATCMCPNGNIGQIHPGLRGECLCSRQY